MESYKYLLDIVYRDALLCITTFIMIFCLFMFLKIVIQYFLAIEGVRSKRALKRFPYVLRKHRLKRRLTELAWCVENSVEKGPFVVDFFPDPFYVLS